MTEEYKPPQPRRGRPRTTPEAQSSIEATPAVDPTVAALKEQIAAMQSQMQQMNELLAHQNVSQPESFSDQSRDGVYLFHIVKSGFTAFGNVWDAGQEIEVVKDSKDYKATVDRAGRSWLDLTEEQQVKRYGCVYFRKGPWPGKKLSDLTPSDFESLKHLNDDGREIRPSDAEIKKLAIQEKQRGRRPMTVSVSEFELPKDVKPAA